MYVISGVGVADVWPEAIELLAEEGVPSASRAGPVRVVPCPVTTVYEDPTRRVLLDPVRDCNPFFHFFEALWMLAGRDDARWLDQFVSDFSSRFAESDGRMHGAYGRRWRGWFSDAVDCNNGDNRVVNREGDETDKLDQLDQVVRLLRANPDDRQAVVQMWDPSSDLGVLGLKDRPCNQQVMLRVRSLTPGRAGWPDDRRVLDATVTCRSNDVVWGCYGSNVVHFSVLQEYLAARIGVGVGRYYQVSNNWHAYESADARVHHPSALENARRPYPGSRPLVDSPDRFDAELHSWMTRADCTLFSEYDPRYSNTVFDEVATPMFRANARRRDGDYVAALEFARKIAAPDWRAACVEWLERRVAARAAKEASR